MNKLGLFGVCLASLVLVSCATMVPGLRGQMMVSGVSEKVDDFDGSSRTVLNLYMPSMKYMAEIAIGFEATKSNSQSELVMYSYLYQSDWTFVEEIAFNIDGQVTRLQSLKSNRDVMPYGYVQELNYFSVDASLLQRLAVSKDVKIRISGKSYFMDVTYDQAMNSLVRSFLSRIE